ncbi:MAG TPA: jacalin-like lectin [Allosphingosinicella sp.]
MTLFKTPSYGGGGGTPWDDGQALAGTPAAAFKRIAVRTGTLVDKIETTYQLENGNFSTLAHGGDGGSPAAFDLVPQEILIGIQGRSGALVDQISFLTAVVYGGGDPPFLQTRGPYGGGGGAPFTIWGEIAAFYGRSGSLIDSIGCYLSTETAGPFGGGGGGAFQDPGPVPDLSRILRITVRSGSLIDSIATTYLLPDGSSQTFSHGGTGGTAHDIYFNPGEQIIAVVGRSGDLLDNIAFLTEDPQGVRRTYGPFGGNGGTQFIVNRKVNGFFGRSGALIDQLGFFVS